MFSLLPTLVLLATLGLRTSAALYDSVGSLPTLEGYDFVIVGGGTAGCVLANRLSEEAKFQVLIIEAGPSDRGVHKKHVDIPYYNRHLKANLDVLWNTTFQTRSELNGRAISLLRGRLLGGSGSMSGMVYTRGSAEDYDHYANMSGDPGWSWEALQPYFKKIERFGPSTDGHNTTGQYDPAVHGADGIVNLTLSGYQLDIDPLLMQATKELDDDFKYLLDMNAGAPLGIGWMQSTIENGKRAGASTSYLAETYLNRPNLHVLVETTASRVLSPGAGRIDTVEVVDRDAAYNITASKEVILAAGVVGSPEILLKSGIGNATVLTGMNISVIHDLPSVGQNVSDQPFVHVQWYTNSSDRFSHILENATLEQAALTEWQSNRTGPMTLSTRNVLVWLRVNETDPEVQEMFRTYGDPAPGKQSPHIEFMPDNGVATPNVSSFDLQSVILHPMSRGSVTLNPSDPYGPPILDGGYFSHPADLVVQKQAVYAALRLASAPAFANYITEPFPGLASFYQNGTVDDLALEAYIRNTSLSELHMVGSMPMSPLGASWGAIDPDFKVKGLRGLRVVDASAVPSCPSAHSLAAVYVFAERASDLVKKEYA